MQQYCASSGAHPESVLFYRMGDFYGCSTMMRSGVGNAGHALTPARRSRGRADSMAGCRRHPRDCYLDKLVRKGQSVAICATARRPGKTQGPEDREVVRIGTPGTVNDEARLRERATMVASVCARTGATDSLVTSRRRLAHGAREYRRSRGEVERCAAEIWHPTRTA